MGMGVVLNGNVEIQYARRATLHALLPLWCVSNINRHFMLF